MLSDVFAMTLNTLRIELPFYQSQLQGEYRRAGLWRAFNPLTQTVVELLEGGATTSRRTTTYTYNLSATGDGGQYGNLLSVEERDQNSAVVRTTAYSYATRDDTGAYLVDRPWQELTRNGANGIVSLTHTFYDDQNITAKALGTRGLPTRVLGYASLNNATTLSGTYQGQDTVATYDLWGNKLTTVTYAGYGSGTVSGSSWSYSAPGGGSTARTTTTTYNDNSLRVFPTQVTYPTVGGVTLSEQAGYDYRMGTLTSVTDANGVVTSATYDLFGRLDKLVEAGDSTTNPTEDVDYYDTEKPFRVLVKQRETAGSSAFRPVQHFYDGLGRLIQEKTESINVTTSAGQNIIVDTRYNGLGLVTQSAQARYVSENSSTTFYKYTPVPGSGINWTTTAYDLLGRPLTITQPDTTATSYSYTIDTALLMAAAQTVNARGHKSRQLTDSLDRLRKVEEYSGTSPSWTLYAATTYEYDALDRLTVGTDQKGNLSSVGYDSLGRKGTLLDPDMGSWSYMYDPNSNLIRQTDSRGQRVCFFYDALNRLTGKHHNGTSDTCPGTPSTITYSYDAFVSGSNYGKGRQTGMSSPDHSVAWKYNARGQVTEAAHTVAGVTRTFVWGYDSADRVSTLTYPAIGADPAEQVTYTYDAAWRPTSLCAGSDCYIKSSATWTALGQPDSWTQGNDLIQDWTYNAPMQRLQRLSYSYSGSSSGRFDRSYTYDPVGNISTVANHLSRQTHRYTYDHRERLTRAWITNDASGPPALGMIDAPAASDVGSGLLAEPTESFTSLDEQQQPAPAAARSADTAAFTQLSLPLSFVANAGQTDAEVRYTTRGQGGTIFFTDSEVVFALVTRPVTETKKLPPEYDPTKGRSRGVGVLRMQFERAERQPQLVAGELLPGQANYFLSQDSADWQTNLSTYRSVAYGQLYPGIELRYDGVEGQLKSTYTVAPGADPSAISWRYKGAQSVTVDAGGNLQVTVPVKQKDPASGAQTTEIITVTEQAPVAWQELDGARQAVDVQFVVAPNERVSFVLGSYDPARPLIIDPVLSYAPFIGGNGGEYGQAIAVDSSGNAYIAGYTDSTDFPKVNPLPGETGLEAWSDAIVLKVNATGTALLYSTYLGGNAGDNASDIVVDSAGAAYVVGSTGSTNFPLASAYQSLLNQGSGSGGDFFVAKLSPTGNALTYSTYLGGSGNDNGYGIGVDGSGQATVTGEVGSTNFPTLNPRQASNGGGIDAAITKLNATGNGLIYSTYLGGSGYERGFGLAVDSSGNAYATGKTLSANFPLASAEQTTGTAGDAFVTKLNASGSAYIYSTYLGGSLADEGMDITADSSGNAYVTGFTNSSNFPTLNAIQSTIGSTYQSDAFVTKLNATGTRVMSTYLGGTEKEEGRAIAVDSGGQVYVVGSTLSTNYPVADPLRYISDGGDGFVSVLNAAGTSFVYSTYLGGRDFDIAEGVAVDGSGNTYISGNTSSPDFLSAPVPPRTSPGNLFAVKLLPGGAFDESYAYDELGNLTTKAGVAYSYGANGNATGAGPHQARSIGGQSYSYDATGNLLSGGGRSYTWNAESRLTQVVQGGLTESYGYSGTGERVKKVVGSTTTLYLEGLWEETLGGAASTKTLYQFGGQTVATRESSTGLRSYLVSDPLGSLSFEQNSEWSGGQDYDPWGKVRSGSLAQTSQNYTGQRLDATGLLYYNARFYDPALGRFISADTLVPGAGALTTWPSDGLAAGAWGVGGGGPENPQNLNRYSYAGNNPTTFNDPTGHIAWIVGAAAIGAVINVAATVAITYATTGKPPTPGAVMSAALSGAATGALSAVGGPLIGMAAKVVGQRVAAVGVPIVASVVADTAAGLIGAVADNAAQASTKAGPNPAGAIAAGLTSVAVDSERIGVSLQGNMDTLEDISRTIQRPQTPARWLGPRAARQYTERLAIRSFNSRAALINAGLAVAASATATALYDNLIRPRLPRNTPQ